MPSYHPHCPILPSWCGVESFVRPMEFVRSVRALVGWFFVSRLVIVSLCIVDDGCLWRTLESGGRESMGSLPPESTLQKSVVLQ